MGIVEQKNQRLGIDSRKKVSTGVVVKAMLLNGLGFVSAPSSRIPLRLASARGRSSVSIRAILSRQSDRAVIRIWNQARVFE